MRRHREPFFSSLPLLAGLLAISACGGDPVASGTDDAAVTDDGDVGAPDAPVKPDGGPKADLRPSATPDLAVAPSSHIRIIVEPGASTALLDAVKGAKKSVHMVMYELTSTALENALIAQHQAGRDVAVLLNQSFGGNNPNLNQSSYAALSSGGVKVAWAPSSFTFTHEKCVILDGVEAWIMTMNGTVTAPTQNREYLAVDDDPADVAEAEAILQADFHGQPAPVNGALLVAPVNARARLQALVNGATSTLLIEGEEFSDYTLRDAVAAAADRHVTVKLVLSNVPGPSGQAQAIQTIKQHGAKVVVLASPYVHAKAMVADGARAYVGSENFTTGSLQYNRELGVIFDAPSEVAKVATTIEGDFAKGTPQ